MYRFAWKTLASDRGKLLTALIGVVFSLVLVNVQGGLYYGLIRKATVLIDHCDADIWVGHRLVENVDLPHEIPQVRIDRIRGLPDVEQAEPYIVGKGIATLPNGGYEDVWVVGADPRSMLGGGWAFTEGSRTELLRPHAVSFDELDAHKLGNPRIGDLLEVNGHKVRIVAKTRGILGFLTTPYFFTTLETARTVSGIPDGYCSYFLVRARQGADLDNLVRQIRGQVPDLDVYRADEFARLSQDYWMRRTGIGISFGAATLLGLLVGFLMVGQSLYALALDHISDYATLKAIGADDGQVGLVVILQALSIAVVGTALGIALVWVIERTLSSPLAPIEIPLHLLLGGIVVVFGICIIASILPFLRIRRIDPATVLQG